MDQQKLQKTVALGRVVLHLKLKNVTIALECGALRLIRRAFSNDACYIYCALTLSLFGNVEEGRLNRSLLYECANFPGSFFYRKVVTCGCGYIHK